MTAGSGKRVKAHELLEIVVGDILTRLNVFRKDHYRTGVTGLLGQEIIVDWYVPHTQAFERGLYIECKWQQSGGSANKKLVGMPKEIRQCYKRPTCIVIDGSRTTNELKMLKALTGGDFIDAFSLSEFLWFASTDLVGDTVRITKTHLLQGGLF